MLYSYRVTLWLYIEWQYIKFQPQHQNFLALIGNTWDVGDAQSPALPAAEGMLFATLYQWMGMLAMTLDFETKTTERPRGET